MRAAVVQDFDQQMSHGSAELTRLTTRRRDLEAERVKLLQAHYAGAVPLDLLKTEQDRIGEELRIINARIDGQKSDYRTARAHYQTARAHLDDCLALLVDCHAQYLGADDQTRRLFNQATFERIYLDEAGEFRADYTRPYSGLLDPDVHRQALERAAQGGEGPWSELVHHAASSNNGPLVLLRTQFENLSHPIKVLVRRLQKGVLTIETRPDEGRRRDARGRVAAPKWKARTSLPSACRAALIADYEDGVGVVQLARSYGVHRDTVRGYLNDSQIERRRRSMTANRQREAVELYRSGRTLQEVGEALGTSKRTVGRVLAELGVERRPAARRRAAAY